jgi:DNA repair exonuclease SbcCD ATPase subunit
MSDQPVRPSLSTNPDESPVGGRRPAAAGRKARGADRPPEAESTGGGRGLIYALIVVALAGSGAAGWFIVEQQAALAASAAELEAARGRILALEERLNMTAENLNKTGESTSEKIDFWESEIRKLWDVVNKRNLDMIKANAAAIERIDKAVGEASASVADVAATVGRHEAAFQRQEQIVDQVTALGAQLQQTQRAVRDAVDRANAAQQSVAGLNAGLAKRVTEAEQAVQAFDAYRLQTNARLADIERRIGAPPL